MRNKELIIQYLDTLCLKIDLKSEAFVRRIEARRGRDLEKVELIEKLELEPLDSQIEYLCEKLIGLTKIQMSNNQTNNIINEQKFQPLTAADIINILGLTIKRDETNKLLAFMAMLSAYTEDSQLNISFNAPSSTGKSFIPMEIAKLFPKEDLLEIGYCSPTAFFHDCGEFEAAIGGYKVDLSRKILVFLDQPHTMLLQHLRPMLSHDKKEIGIKITDKAQKHGLKTKNIFLIGYPTVIFCTAGLDIDEQEATRFLLLSPDADKEKLREAILEKIKKDSNRRSYREGLENNCDRQLLEERIRAIKQENVQEIKILHPELIEKMFFEKFKGLKPRSQRDVGRILNLTKAFCLLNLWFRDRDGEALIANDNDVIDAFRALDQIFVSQDLGLPPFIYNLYKDVILVAYSEKNSIGLDVELGLSRREILKKHYEVYNRFLPDWQLRQQILPMLETSGLIRQELGDIDRREKFIYPIARLEKPPEVTMGGQEVMSV